MSSIFLKHQLHLRDLNPSDLRSSCEAHGVVRDLDLDFLAHKLLDLDGSLRLFAIDHIDEQDGIVAVLLVFCHHDNIHLYEAHLYHIFQHHALHML